VLDVIDVKLLPERYIIKRWTREAKNGSVQDARGQTVQLYANLSETQRYRSLCPKLVKLASRASESQEACELLERLISEVSTQIESICITHTKGNVDDSGVDGSSSEGKGTKENDVTHMNVQGLKKKVGQKGRRRIKSSLEKQSKKKRVQSEEKIMQSKVKGFLNIHPQASMNNNNSSYDPFESTMLFDQGLDSHSLFHGSQASHTYYNGLATEKEN
ncbi:FAR-RED impaired response 1-like protein, partial [Tanacetum coccineum]